MPGLYFRGSGGVGGGAASTIAPSSVPNAAASSVAPSVAAYGPGSTLAVPSGGKFSAGHAAITAGFVAGGLMALTWWSLPGGDRNEYGKLIFTVGLGVIFFKGIALWGKVHVADGDTNIVYSAASLL